MSHEPRDAPSPQVGWGVYKEENPDQYRTPVKEEGPFQWGEQEQEHEMGIGARGPNRRFRGGREQRDPRWNRGGRGGQEWQRNGGGGRGGVPFGRGGRGGGPGVFPGIFPNIAGIHPGTDLSAVDPETIRKEVIPTLIRMGEQGRDSGTINEVQFRDLMKRIMIIKESSLIREAEIIDSRRGGRGGSFGGPFPPRGGLLGPPPAQAGEVGPPSLLSLPAVEKPLATRSPHKNDLPMAEPGLLEAIEADPTKCLNIDDVPRTIRYSSERVVFIIAIAVWT